MQYQISYGFFMVSYIFISFKSVKKKPLSAQEDGISISRTQKIKQSNFTYILSQTQTLSSLHSKEAN